MFQNTFRKLYSCFVVDLRSFPQSFASGAPVVGVCTVVTKYAQRTIFKIAFYNTQHAFSMRYDF